MTSEEEQLNLSGKKWQRIPKISRIVPFGYYVDENDPEMLVPNIFELEALEKAKYYRKRGYSWRKIAEWLTDITGRPISHTGIRKRIGFDKGYKRKATRFEVWAGKYETTIRKAKEHGERVGEDTSFLDDILEGIKYARNKRQSSEDRISSD